MNEERKEEIRLVADSDQAHAAMDESLAKLSHEELTDLSAIADRLMVLFGMSFGPQYAVAAMSILIAQGTECMRRAGITEASA